MLTIVTALLVGFATGALLRLTGLLHSMAAIVFVAVAATLVTLVLLMRRFGKKVQPIVEDATRHLQAGRRELALKSLKDGLSYKNWHPMLEGQLRAQIGAIYYVSGELDQSIDELRRAASRPSWEAKAFLACAYFKKRNEDDMKKAFETVVKVGKKEPIAWTLYAWCMNARGKKDEAAAILERALKQVTPNSVEGQRLQANLEAVKAGKKLKVAPYGERWASFMVDGSAPAVPKLGKGFSQRPGFRPGFRQKPLRPR